MTIRSEGAKQATKVLLAALGMVPMSQVYGQTAGEAGGAAQTGTQSPKRIVTQGLAKTVIDNLFKCEVKVTNHRISAVGTITATDGTVLTVPAETGFQNEKKLPDLFNECNKATP